MLTKKLNELQTLEESIFKNDIIQAIKKRNPDIILTDIEKKNQLKN
jgi:hypothetical protein